MVDTSPSDVLTAQRILGVGEAIEFVTPPGKWHSHHNETEGDAHLIPIQDAGLHTYLRTLDIRFSPR